MQSSKKDYESQHQIRDILPLSIFKSKMAITPTQEYDEAWFQAQPALNELFPKGFEEFKYYFEGTDHYFQLKGGGVAMGNEGGATQTQQEEVVEEKQEKVAFDVQLEEVDKASKIKVIKEVRTLLGLGLKDAKDAVEKLPNTLKSGITKEEAEALKETLEKLGCKVNLL